MNRQWTEFESGIRQPASDRMYVSMNRRGLMVVNRKAFESLGSPAGAALLFDERHQAIGLRPATPGERNFIPIKEKRGVSYRTIYVLPFIKRFKLNLSGTIGFVTPEIDHEGILVLDMHTAVESRRG